MKAEGILPKTLASAQPRVQFLSDRPILPSAF